MKTCGGVEVHFHTFLTSTPDGGEWLAPRSGRFSPGEGASSTLWIEGWMGSRAGLDAVEKKRNPASARNWTPVVQPVT